MNMNISHLTFPIYFIFQVENVLKLYICPHVSQEFPKKCRVTDLRFLSEKKFQKYVAPLNSSPIKE